jgi:hypothetical protein
MSAMFSCIFFFGVALFTLRGVSGEVQVQILNLDKLLLSLFFFVEIASADVKSHVCLVNLTQTMHPGLYLVASLTCSFLVK